MKVPAPSHVGQEDSPSCETQALKCLLDVFSSLKCTRKPKGRRYSLSATMSLVLVGLLSGCKNPSQIYVFGKTHPDLLPKLGFHPPVRPRIKENRNRIASPNEDTITTILGLVDKEELNEKLALFLFEMIEKRSVAAIDGKALRGSGDYVLSIFVNEIRHVVWQENVEKKQNEQSALENVLGTILEKYPQIKLFTGDASFCQKKFAKAFIKARRNYFLQLKSPHNTDVELAKDAFRQISPAMPPAARTLGKRGARKGRKS